ncbi:MAG TPA: YncE family protein [Rhodopila sp.]|nr:YncE family protein [Rhodopila sp.]
MRHLTRRLCAIAALSIPAITSVHAAPAYTLTASVPLGGPERWDYVAFDPATQRVYVAHGDNITVVDAARLTVAGQLSELQGAHGVAPVPDLGKVFADSGRTGTVTEFDAKTLASHTTIKAVDDADGMLYDPATHQVVVLGGGATAGFIDPATDNLISVLPLGGKPEGAASDTKGHLYVALADREEVAVIDMTAHQVGARLPLHGCHKPHGVALDATANRLFVSCPEGKMAVLDTANGKQVALLPIGKFTDAAVFDATRHVALSANADGTLGVVAETPSGVRSIGNMKTTPGARTLAIDPATGRLFIVAATVVKTGAPRKPGGRPELTFAPGSLHLLVYAPVTAPQH